MQKQLPMIVILTGATGTLGSNVLYELLKTKFNEVTAIYLLVREKGSTAPEERIRKMLSSDYAPDSIKNNIDHVFEKVNVISSQDFLNPSSFLDKNKSAPTYFIHSAGYVNLSVRPEDEKEIFDLNFGFSTSLFEAYKDYISKFVYISTAFSAGDIGGMMHNEYPDEATTQYRNYYEKAKHATEIFLKNATKEKGIPLQILRPSVLGGNSIEQPSFFISKYMVFYLFAKFFYRCTSLDSIRISANSKTGLNIIPTDYAAKVIVKVFESDILQLNIVHSKGTNIVSGIAKIMETVGFNNFSIQSDTSHDAGTYNGLEKFYYSTIGVHLEPYLRSKPYEWDTTLLESILPIPTYDLEEYLVNTVAYAKTKGFRNQNW